MRWVAAALVGIVAGGTAAAHDPVTWNGTDYRVLLSAEDSDGRIGIFLSEVDQASGPPLHVHDDADETFYVLAGTTVFWVDGEERTVEPGGAAFVPRGVEHTFRVVDPEGGRHLTIVTPGGFESFFAAVAEEGLEIREDMTRIGEIAAAYQLRFTGPPLPAE